MAIQLISGSGSNLATIDSNGNLSVNEGVAALPAAGGYYTVAGQTSAVVAASLAANTTLMSMRFSPSSTRKAYITRFRVLIGVATVGTSALVAGTLGLQRFNNATPTGGTARTANLQNQSSSGTDMTDIRDSNAALTVTSVNFGSVVSAALVPLFIASGPMWFEWCYEPSEYPTVLNPGDGLCLRTQVVMPATQTWMYSYAARWIEM